ncbi:MAG: processing protein [Methanofollis sp.]|nr:processing protein [Methanofollis sp.]
MSDNTVRELALLACLNDVHSLKKREYVERFSDPTALHTFYTDIFETGAHAIGADPDLPVPILEKAADIRARGLLDFYIDIIRGYRQKGIRLLPAYDPDYPKKLLDLDDPPFMIYWKGNGKNLSKPAVAIVGTRNISPESIEKISEIVELFVSLGYVIVSGLARGTDAHAHKAALDCGGETIAVLPGDLTNIVPKENEELSQRIVTSGSLVSEVTNLAKMHKGRYVERNRITSGLSDAVIVIETGESGGSIRQAEIARKQGKPLYSIKPDPANTGATAGHTALISMSATSVQSPQDFLRYFAKQQNPVSRMTTLADFS